MSGGEWRGRGGGSRAWASGTPGGARRVGTQQSSQVQSREAKSSQANSSQIKPSRVESRGSRNEEGADGSALEQLGMPPMQVGCVVHCTNESFDHAERVERSLLTCASSQEKSSRVERGPGHLCVHPCAPDTSMCNTRTDPRPTCTRPHTCTATGSCTPAHAHMHTPAAHARARASTCSCVHAHVRMLMCSCSCVHAHVVWMHTPSHLGGGPPTCQRRCRATPRTP